jgi:hypothetical protein
MLEITGHAIAARVLHSVATVHMHILAHYASRTEFKKPQNACGVTENHSFQYTRPDDRPGTIANTCRRPWEGMEIKLWDEIDTGREVPYGS